MKKLPRTQTRKERNNRATQKYRTRLQRLNSMKELHREGRVSSGFASPERLLSVAGDRPHTLRALASAAWTFVSIQHLWRDSVFQGDSVVLHKGREAKRASSVLHSEQ